MGNTNSTKTLPNFQIATFPIDPAAFNALYLCDGTLHPIVNFTPLGKRTPIYTIDKDEDQKPHIVGDVLQEKTYHSIPKDSISLVFMSLCHCCTRSVTFSLDKLFKLFKPKLKSTAVVLVVFQSVKDWDLFCQQTQLLDNIKHWGFTLNTSLPSYSTQHGTKMQRCVFTYSKDTACVSCDKHQ